LDFGLSFNLVELAFDGSQRDVAFVDVVYTPTVVGQSGPPLGKSPDLGNSSPAPASQAHIERP
jgi:hypothetical protein